MKKVGAAILLILVLAGIWLLLEQKPTTKAMNQVGATDKPGETNASVAPKVSPANSTVPTATANPEVQPPAPSQPVATVPAPEAVALPPATVLDNLRVVVHNYGAEFGGNPVGNNAEITAALKGKNPRQISFLRDDAGLRVNDRGELVDAYGTPFFFHQLSGKVMEIRSAGEDRTLWTFDDLVTK